MSEKSFIEDVTLDFIYLSKPTLQFMEDRWTTLAAEVSDFDDPVIVKELNLMNVWWRARLQHLSCDAGETASATS